jgi:transformation/transcription domain-associated protein
MVYTALADALSHMWSDLGLAQVQRILEVYTRVMHNPTMPINAHTAAIRLFQSVVDVLPTKIQANAEIARALTTIFETVADRLEVGCVMYGDALARLPVNSEEEEGTTSAEQIEKTRPMQSPSYVFDRPDLVIQRECTFESWTFSLYNEQTAASSSCRLSTWRCTSSRA